MAKNEIGQLYWDAQNGKSEQLLKDREYILGVYLKWRFKTGSDNSAKNCNGWKWWKGWYALHDGGLQAQF